MTQLLQQFVFRCLKELGATSTEQEQGVWRIELPGGDGGRAASCLGRTEGEFVVTFDSARWEEDSRVEYVTPVSMLVRCLLQCAEARGGHATATMQSDPDAVEHGGYKYHPYLLCRFRARYSSFNAIEDRRWLGISLTTGIPVKVEGDPLGAEGIIEGEPDPACRLEQKIDSNEALEKLVEAWEQQVAIKAMSLAGESEAAFHAEIEEAERTLERDDLARQVDVLTQRYAPIAESHLEASVLLWR